ncbi:MAG: tRNA preQ1(34) S-adenosylmethionine ribosyltransferase-isomerase QueA [Candidatus Zixiibacteriota bacterium]|nr:MAG: tRNA preQ1(34) S-adenosylmethionine ribosyltransferase-isomerase QueA [candidate division Zixibacteria bacterium]
MSVSLKDYDYPLPKSLIAQYPEERRDHSRLLVLDRKSERIDHRLFYQVIDYLEEGDGLVINQSRVFPARVFGTNQKNDRRVEVFFLKEVGDKLWEVLVKPFKKVPEGSLITFDQTGLTCEILERTESGSRLAKVNFNGDLFEVLEKIGKVPLPPYIKREPEAGDKNTYQTVYARETGAVAAPTAGLHFTPELLEKIERKGVERIAITLHVGWDSFRPVRVEHPEEHTLASEHFKIDPRSAERINRIKRYRKRIVAVGTTTVRALETAAEHSDGGEMKPQSGWTKKFIYPPFKFKVVDSLITNFHLPRSTLLLLVSALASRELIFKAYQEAVEKKYRFYSYGDAMLII